MKYIIAVLKIPLNFFMIPLMWRGSRRLKKWLKKNRKEQNPNLHPFNERWSYIRKLAKRLLWRMNVEVVLEGEENLLKGPMWITTNHTSNYDAIYITRALGHKTSFTPIAKKELESKKLVNGYIFGLDGFILDRSNPRDGFNVIKGAANYSKQNNRSILIFPEGERSKTTDMLEFKAASFEAPKQYALPIVPVTIAGTLEAKRWWIPKHKQVKVIVHTPIKPIEHMKIPRNILSKRVHSMVEKSLLKWENSLNIKEKKLHQSLKQAAKLK